MVGPLVLVMAVNAHRFGAVTGRASMCRARAVLGVVPFVVIFAVCDASCMSLAEPPDRLRHRVQTHLMRLLAIAHINIVIVRIEKSAEDRKIYNRVPQMYMRHIAYECHKPMLKNQETDGFARRAVNAQARHPGV